MSDVDIGSSVNEDTATTAKSVAAFTCLLILLTMPFLPDRYMSKKCYSEILICIFYDYIDMFLLRTKKLNIVYKTASDYNNEIKKN